MWNNQKQQKVVYKTRELETQVDLWASSPIYNWAPFY